jgi:hypothetical protein
MVGTPPVTWTFSDSINSIARTVSHLRMKIIVEPLASTPIIVALHAVTWNSGMQARKVRGWGAGGSSPRRNAARAPA